jgi:hypothetical protein
MLIVDTAEWMMRVVRYREQGMRKREGRLFLVRVRLPQVL